MAPYLHSASGISIIWEQCGVEFVVDTGGGLFGAWKAKELGQDATFSLYCSFHFFFFAWGYPHIFSLSVLCLKVGRVMKDPHSPSLNETHFLLSSPIILVRICGYISFSMETISMSARNALNWAKSHNQLIATSSINFLQANYPTPPNPNQIRTIWGWLLLPRQGIKTRHMINVQILNETRDWW